MEGGPNFVPPFLKNEIMEQFNWCLIQKTLLCPVSHSVSLPSPPGCYGNLGLHHPERDGVCVSSRQQGDRRVVVPSPPQVKSVFTMDSPVWCKCIWKSNRVLIWIGFIEDLVGFKAQEGFDNTVPKCYSDASSTDKWFWLTYLWSKTKETLFISTLPS